jgi:hypothetical protein
VQIIFMPSPMQLSRPPLERMLRIHEELRRGALVNCTKLVESLEVSRKTVVRDIAFMRDRLDLPIEFDPRLNAYRYTQPVNSFPTVNVTEGELLALLVAQRAWSSTAARPSTGSWRWRSASSRPGCATGSRSPRPTSCAPCRSKTSALGRPTSRCSTRSAPRCCTRWR